MKNHLNDLDSKSYMKFLKSWCIYDTNTLKDFIYFFSKDKDENNQPNAVGIWGFDDHDTYILINTNRHLVDLSSKSNQKISYALIDLREQIFNTQEHIISFFEKELEPLLKKLKTRLTKKSYLTILCSNTRKINSFYPSAWFIGKFVSQYFDMKDEKLLCGDVDKTDSPYFPMAGNKIIFALNFRNTVYEVNTDRLVYSLSDTFRPSQISPWFILKPPPRKEKVKLHPAKFPEILIEQFIQHFSNKGENIFDPMAGTASTLMAAQASERNAYGCEIAGPFYKIALERLNIIDSRYKYYLALDDAYNFNKHPQFPPEFDYIVTSPPYWDMLNMVGAETQKARLQNGLRTNYSDLNTDLGNCPDYNVFLLKLLKIYNKILSHLKAGGYFTIIVKNIKKKGVIYTFAWDLVQRLSTNLSVVDINYWLQDDIRIAPYGYGSAWVSNTFHHYCLTFKKP